MTYRVVAGGGSSAQTAPAAAGMQLEPDWVSSSQLLKAVDVKPLYESIDEAKEMLRADFANGKCRQYRAHHACPLHSIARAQLQSYRVFSDRMDSDCGS